MSLQVHGLLGDRADRWEVKDHGSGDQKDAGDDVMPDARPRRRRRRRTEPELLEFVSSGSRFSWGRDDVPKVCSEKKVVADRRFACFPPPPTRAGWGSIVVQRGSTAWPMHAARTWNSKHTGHPPDTVAGRAGSAVKAISRRRLGRGITPEHIDGDRVGAGRPAGSIMVAGQN